MEPAELLIPYVPRLILEWLQESPDLGYRSIPGTLLFADISGFTDLTERLAHRGKFGAEEMGDILNRVFEELLTQAYDFGAGLIKWGGDAGLFLFHGEKHSERACTAAVEMQKVLRTVGRLTTSVGDVRLRMSVGIHSGDLDFLLVGTDHRDLIVSGPAATAVADMEKVADAGEIVISESTAQLLPPAQAQHVVGARKGAGHLLTASPEAERMEIVRPPTVPQTIVESALAPTMRDHYLSGAVDSEHRQVTVAFVQFTGADALLANEGAAALESAVTEVVDAIHRAATTNDISILEIDVYADGGKALLTAGAPNMRGDNDARILSAARQIIDSHCRLPVKIGVNCGRALAGDFGPRYRRTYSLVGDAVNLGARLMAKAQHGEILATPMVLERARTSYDYETLEPFPVKGKTVLIEAVRVGAATGHAKTAKAITPLIGRRSEMELLTEAGRQVDRLEGQLVDIVGPAGIGKSRLIDELLSEVTWPVYRADGDIYGSATPYQPFHSLFEQIFDLPPTSDPEGRSLALTTAVGNADPELVPWLPLIAVASGTDVAMTRAVEDTGPEFRKERLERVVSALLERTLANPVIIVFNDVHIMDGASVDLLRRLVSDAQQRPWFILTTQRPEAHTPLPAVSYGHRIDLQPLDNEAADQVVSAATDDAPLPVHVMKELVRRASGNPLFLHELISAFRETQDIDALPDSVEGVIAARIDDLDPNRRRLIRTLAVLGMTVDLEILEAFLRMDGTSSQGLAWSDLSEFVEMIDARQISFVHHLTQQAAYEGLPETRRVTLHGYAADVLEASPHAEDIETTALLSLHTHAARRYGPAWTYSIEAAKHARARYANTEAALLYRRTLSAGSHLRDLPIDEVLAVYETLSDIYLDLGEFDVAEEVLRSARKLAPDDPVRSANHFLKAGILRERNGRLSQAVGWFTRGLRLLEMDTGPEAGHVRSELMGLQARVRSFQGKWRESIRWCELAAVEAEANGNLHGLARALETRNWATISLGQLDGDDDVRRASDIFAGLHDWKCQARAEGIRGLRSFHLGRWNEALKHYRAAEQLCHQTGSEWNASIQLANQAEILSDQGHLDAATTAINNSIRVWRGARARGDLAFGYYILGRIASRSGQFDEAVSLFRDSRAYFDELGETQEVLIVDTFMAECSLLAGDWKAALSQADACIARANQQDGEIATLLPLLRIRGRALIALGDVEPGRSNLIQSLEKARSRDAQHEIAFALQALLDSGSAADLAESDSWVQEYRSLAQNLGLVVTDIPNGNRPVVPASSR